MIEFLRKVPLFADLPADDLERICAVSTVVECKAGEILFEEGSLGDKAYIVWEGLVEISKTTGGKKEILAVRPAGDVIGEMALLESIPRNATVRARTDCKFIAIGTEPFNYLIDTYPAAARKMLSTVSARLRSNEGMLRQSEKMAQIGTLTAGIAHELNNPAAAARRGADQLIQIFNDLQQLLRQIGALRLSSTQLKILEQLENECRQHANLPVPESGSIERLDRQEYLESWLEARGVENAWELAPGLVDLDIPIESLDNLTQAFPASAQVTVLAWISKTHSVYSLLNEIMQGTTQIGEIIQALKSYIYLDQAPVQLVDIHEGLNNTLVILRSKLKTGVSLTTFYAVNLPRIQGYGSELNQVWTNLIDNAIDATNGKGEIFLRTRLEENSVIVEIEDNGPGISPEAQDKLFNPFYTTKAVGKGMGLGLNISYNIVQKHNGKILVDSRPGKTTFQVRLPITLDAIQ